MPYKAAPIALEAEINNVTDPKTGERVLVRFLAEFPAYAVTFDGRVWLARKKRFTVGRVNSCGHLEVSCTNDWRSAMFLVARLVACAWLDNPENLPRVTHLNGNPQKNHWTNLDWRN